MAIQRTFKGINRPQKPGGRGKLFEKDLERANSYYFAKKMGYVYRNPEEWEWSSASEYDWYFNRGQRDIVAKTGSGKYLFAKRSLPDFSGNMLGLSVHFEAKSTEGKSLPLTRIKDHQLRFLARQQERKALSGIFVEFADLQRVFFITALFARKCSDEALLKANRKSISLAQFEESGFEIKMNRDRILDWVPVLVKTRKEDTP